MHAVLVSLAALQATRNWCPWCGDHMGWGGGWGMMFGWTLAIVVIVLIVWALGRGRSSDGGHADSGGPPGEDRAEAVVRERYARGEIDEETYRRRLDELRATE